MRFGVYYQPWGSFAKWRSRGIDCLWGYESQGGTVSRQQWIAAAKAAGLKYYTLPSDNPTADAADPDQLGWLMEDEPDRRFPPEVVINGVKQTNPPRATKLTEYRALAQKLKELGKSVLGNFSGPDVTGGMPANVGKWHVEWMEHLTDVSGDWYPANVRGRKPPEPARYTNDLITKMLGQLKLFSPGKRYWAVLESSSQSLPNGLGTGPTPADMDDQANRCRDFGCEGICYFPQKIGGGFAYDNMSAEQVAKLVEIIKRLGTPAPQPVPDLQPQIDALMKALAALAARVNSVEQLPKPVGCKLIFDK